MTVSGIVSDVVTGAPIAGVNVSAADGSSTATDGAGRYSLEFEGDGIDVAGAFEIKTTGKGYLPRTTWVGGDEASHDHTLIAKRDFSLEHFDLLYRNVATTGTRRWLTEPTFVVANRFIDCGCIGRAGCPWWEQDESCKFSRYKVRKKAFSEVKRVLKENAPLLSGGSIRGTQVRKRRVARGDDPHVQSSDGEIVVTMGDMGGTPLSGVGGASASAQGELFKGSIRVAVRVALPDAPGTFEINGVASGVPPRVLAHELAHTFGWRHPLGFLRFELPTVLSNCPSDQSGQQVTNEEDLLYGLIHVSRSPGSTSPDVDSPGSASSQRATTFAWEDPDPELVGRGRTEEQIRPDLEFSGKIGKRDPPCEGSFGRPCRAHTIEVPRAGTVAVELEWSTLKVDLDFDVAPLRTSGFGHNGFVASRCQTEPVQAETFDALEPGEYQLTIIYWGGKKRQGYTARVELP